MACRASMEVLARAHPNFLSCAGEMRPVRISRSSHAYRKKTYSGVNLPLAGIGIPATTEQSWRMAFISISCQYVNGILRFCLLCVLVLEDSAAPNGYSRRHVLECHSFCFGMVHTIITNRGV